MNQTTQKTGDGLASRLEEFINGITDFDRENSMMRYDEAVLKDALSAVRRIENIRRRAEEVGH